MLLEVGEMGENAKRQDGGFRMPSISFEKLTKLHALLYSSTQKLRVNIFSLFIYQQVYNKIAMGVQYCHVSMQLLAV